MPGNKWALLIGIDEYLEGDAFRVDTRSMPIIYYPLRGCVADVLQVERHLIDHMGVCDNRIKKLITQPWDDELPSECRKSSDDEPTYSNITGAMDWILRAAETGDLVYIHYSGHGAQATTVFPMLKGEAGIDEALVPTDINTDAGKYVRDIELTLWLEKMVAKGLIVTVVLDSCHSASATRGSGRVAFRGVPQTYRSTDQDTPSADVMAQVRLHDTGATETYQGSRVKDSWLLEPLGYTLLAACRPRESAREYEQGGEYQGALTYWLLDTLRRNPQAAASTKALYRRLFGKIQSLFTDQTPVIGGTTDRAFFGTDVLPSVNTIVVRKVKTPVSEGQELELAAGTLHSVRKDAQYAIYTSTGDIDPSGDETEPILATVTVRDVLPVTSVATLTEVKDPGKIEPGCRAVLLGVPNDHQFLVALSSSSDPDVVQAVTTYWERQPTRYRAWLKLLPDEDRKQLSFRVAINSSSCFEIQDGDGVVLPNIVPPLRPLSAVTCDRAVLERLIYRLKHLALFNMFKNLENDNEVSAMRGALLFEVLGKSVDGTENSSPANLAPVDDQQGMLVAREQDMLFVRVKNISNRAINFAIFDLQPLYGIQMIYPHGGEFETLDQDQELVIPLQMTFPEAKLDSSSVVDTIKVLASPQPIPVGALQLDDLDEAENKGLRTSSSATNNLQSMVQHLIKPERNSRVPVRATEQWGTEELIIRTFREGASMTV